MSLTAADVDPLTLAPPRDHEAEAAALGAALNDPQALPVVLRTLRQDDFADDAHKSLFAVLGDVCASLEPGEKLDLVIVEGALRDAGTLDEVGGRQFLIDLVDSYPTARNVRQYCEAVRRAAAQRALLIASLEAARRAAQPGADPVAILAEAEADLKRISARARTAAPQSLRALVAAHPELRTAVVRGLLRQGETVNIIAPSKTGKSWLAAGLALAVATGRRWLDMYDCERGDVLILDNELHSETSANRLPRVAEALGIPLAEVADHVFVENLRGRLMDIYGLRDYLGDVQPGRYKIIVLDAFYRFLPKGADENDNATMAGFYNLLDSIADRLGCSFVLIHHASKGSQSSKAVADVGAGAGAQARATDTHLILRPHESDGAFVLEAAVRSWPPISPTCLRWTFPTFTPEPELDPTRLRPERPRRPRLPKEEGPPVKVWTVADFTAAFVMAKPQPRASIIEAARAAGLSENRAKSLLAAAVAGGQVHRWKDGRNVAERFATAPQSLLDPKRTP